jgi:DNA polymerase-3 subunit alpha
MFFGSDFVNFGNYCKRGLFLLMRGRIAPKWQGSDQQEFKTSKIELLQEMAERAESLKIGFSVENLSEELVEELDLHLSKFPGKSVLKFVVQDSSSNIKLDLFSRTKRVGLTPDLKAYLQKKPDIVFTIN